MPRTDAKTLIRNVEHRLSTIEQILPTLATKDDVRDVVEAATAPLATRAELLATREELRATRDELYAALRAEADETRRHFDAVGESIRMDVRIIAEGCSWLSERLGTLESSVSRDKAPVDQRLLRLEARPQR